MKRITLDTLATRILLVCVVVTLVLLPFHATLTVWLSQAVGHYTALRLWKEVLLAVSLLPAGYFLMRDAALRRQLCRGPLIWLIIAYAGLLILVGAISYAWGEVTLKALAYGELVDLRFLAFFVVVWVLACKTGFLRHWWQLLLLGPAAAVIAFGLLQRFVLPYDFLKHLGYNTDTTIPPYTTIDKKLSYLRIQSTLRGANPLGIYLVLIVTALGTLLLRLKDKRWWRLLAVALGLLALVLTYSRSAWIGALLSAVAVVLMVYRSRNAQRLLAVGTVALVVALAGAFMTLRNNDHFQNTFFHTDEHSTSRESSNSGHLSALKHGVKDIVHQPLGNGTGTAGPASVYNEVGPTRIAENYFIQLGQEAGVVAIGLFVAINLVVARGLWRDRGDLLSLILLASLVGITFGNLLWHAWTDDTLAYLWWGFAGLALAPSGTHKDETTA